MLWTNTDGHGGKFFYQVESEFSKAKGVIIASGYVSLDIISKFGPIFEKIAENGGQAKLLVGMALYEGLTPNKLNFLNSLSSKLESTNTGSGIFVSYNGKFHGKIYIFNKSSGQDIYLGSSNFSRSGLSENVECTARVQDADTQNKLSQFIDYLFHSDNSVSILKADIIVQGSGEYKKRVAVETLEDLPKYDVTTINPSILPKFEYPLSRIADKGKSSLNVYFGKGRWTRSTDKVRPRNWYEVELIANKEIRSFSVYPKGEFQGYTDDGYIIPMVTNGAYNKNIRSKGNLLILGQWIKNKLQRGGALVPLTPVTQDTLDAYGRDSIKFYKIEDGKYYMEF